VPPKKLPLTNAPLKSQYFHALLAVASEPAHGYAIKQDIETRGGGRFDPGSLYRLIARLLDEGLIREVDDPSGAATDSRRRYYGITPLGTRTLKAEADRMAALVKTVRALS
jgi:DNA-binding PadR family transcriptional regulator